MIYKNIFIATLSIFLPFLLACAPKEAPAPELARPDKAPVKEDITAKEGWEVEWDRTLRAAQKEGRVMVYSGPGLGAILRLEAIKPFKERFGIELDIVSAPAALNVAKLRAERAAGLYLADIITGVGGHTIFRMKEWGWVEPWEALLILPEVLDTKAWYGGELPWKDKDKTTLGWAGVTSPEIAVNHERVQPEEIKSYHDLLNPKWKGKISIQDPTDGSGSGFTSFTRVIHFKDLDVDFFRQLLRQQDPMVTSDWRLQSIWLAQGKRPIALWPPGAMLKQYKAEGAPISDVHTKEGRALSLSGTATALMNKAPHPNAARIFLNWYLSREGQLIVQNGVDKQSMRVDIPTDKLTPEKIRIPGHTYRPDPLEIEEFVLKEHERYWALSKEVFGPALGR